MSQTGLVCNLTAIPEAERKRHRELATALFSSYQEKQEWSDGYAFGFAAEAYSSLTDYIANERLCCPFLRFEILIEAHEGPIWLYLRGEEAIRTFLNGVFKNGELGATKIA